MTVKFLPSCLDCFPFERLASGLSGGSVAVCGVHRSRRCEAVCLLTSTCNHVQEPKHLCTEIPGTGLRKKYTQGDLVLLISSTQSTDWEAAVLSCSHRLSRGKAESLRRPLCSSCLQGFTVVAGPMLPCAVPLPHWFPFFYP